MDNMRLSFDEIDTPLGTLFILFDGDILYGICTDLSLDIIEQRFSFYFSASTLTPEIKKKKIPDHIYLQFREYFTGKRQTFELKTVLDLPEARRYFSDFELRIWNIVKRIPFGEIRSYGWLANEAGVPLGQRAVGQALKKNPLPIVIPCHRIVGTNGKLCGYSLGLELKRRLLMHECYKNS